MKTKFSLGILLVILCCSEFTCKSFEESFFADSCERIVRDFLKIDLIYFNFYVRRIVDLVESRNDLFLVNQERQELYEIDFSCLKNLYSINFDDDDLIRFETFRDENRIITYHERSNRTYKVELRFHNLKKIQSLVINSLQMETFKLNLLIGFCHLRDLVINEGKMRYMERGFLKNHHDLYYFYVYGSNIRSTSQLALDLDSTSSYSVGSLMLMSSQIETLDASTFVSFGNLHELDLSRNLIRSLSYGVFKHLKSLKQLRIVYNLLKSINSGDFFGLTNLIELGLFSNLLESFDKHAFNGLNNLMELNLNNNSLRSLKNLSMNSLKHLTDLKLTMNKIEQLDLKDEVCERSKEKPIKITLSKNSLLFDKSNKSTLSFGCIHYLSFLELSQSKLNDKSNIFIRLANVNQIKILLLENVSIEKLISITIESSNATEINGLDLSNNEIESLENVTFRGLSNLKLLLFRYNRIKSIDSIDFHGIENLESLDLANNKIKSINRAKFKSIEKLRNLYLDRNLIESIDFVSIEGLNALTMLSLTSNKIKSIDQVHFEGICQLEILKLDYNEIQSLESISLRGIEKLKRIYILKNRLRFIESINFKGIKDLELLDLSYNNIELGNSTTKKIQISGLPNLVEFKLTQCFIKHFFNVTFVGIENSLKKLDLKMNQIEFLENVSIRGLSRLNELDLSLNYFDNLEHPPAIVVDKNRQTNDSERLIYISFYGNYLSKISPSSFPLNYRLLLNTGFRQSALAPLSKFIYDDHLKLNLIYIYHSRIDIKSTCSNSHLFIIGKKTEYLKAYQSIPIRFDNHESLKVNCSVLFAFYRKCFLVRYLIGTRSEYDLFIEKCKSEKLDPSYQPH